jgi:hypothetical protein
LNDCNSKNNNIDMTSGQLQRAILALDENELKDWMTDLSPAPPHPWSQYHRYMNIDHIHLQAVNMWVHGAPHWLGSSVWTAAHEGGDHTHFTIPPPWNPTLKDVEDLITEETELDPFYGRPLDGYYRDWVGGTLVKILQYRGRFNVDIYSPLLGEHLTYLNSLCNEFEVLYGRVEVTDTDEGEDEGEDAGEGEGEDAFDLDSEEDAEYPMEPLSPETLRIINRNLDAEFLAEADAITHSITTDAAETVSRRLQETETQNSLCSEGVNILDRIMDTDTRELNEGDYLKLMNLFRDLHT